MTKFTNIYCSQCGQSFGLGASGFSACKDHQGKANPGDWRDTYVRPGCPTECVEFEYDGFNLEAPLVCYIEFDAGTPSTYDDPGEPAIMIFHAVYADGIDILPLLSDSQVSKIEDAFGEAEDRKNAQIADDYYNSLGE
jgi:hypothetical protein